MVRRLKCMWQHVLMSAKAAIDKEAANLHVRS